MPRHGENIRKRKDGRWEARYVSSFDPEGKAKYRSVYANSYDDVKAKRKAIQNQIQLPVQRTDLSFHQVADMWLSGKKATLKRSSYNHYSNQYYQHIYPIFSSVLFSSVTSEDINLFLKQKIYEDYSPATVIGLRTIILMILRYAKRNDIACSVRDDLYIPKNRQNDVKAFTRAEQKKIDDYLKEHPSVFNLSVYLSMYCGLRIGEVCALQWKDIHFDQGAICISKTLIRIQNKYDSDDCKTEVVFQQPKTDSSMRVIPIPSFILPVIEKYKDQDEIFVITGKSGSMEPRVCLRKFKKMIHRIDVSDYTFHSCRHTFATRCIEVGMDAKTLSEILGHSSVKTTLDRYVHPSIDLKRSQMNKLENISASVIG